MVKTVGISALALVAVAALLGPRANAGGHRAAHRPPNFSGLWTNNSLTELERPDDFKALVATDGEANAFEKANRGKPPAIGDKTNPVGGPDSEWWERDVSLARIRGQLRTSWIVSPADGALPFTPAARAANKATRSRQRVDLDGPESRDLDERCASIDAAGPPLNNGGLNDNFQFVQTPDHLVVSAEWMHAVRIVRLVSEGNGDARHPPQAIRLPMGDSIGHWEGKTLTIETTNFRPQDVKAPDGDPRVDMRIVERLTRLSPTEILYAFTVSNPARYTQTWQAEMLLRTTKGPIYEYACHEGNYALAGMLAAARRLEGRTIDGVSAGGASPNK